MILPEFSQFLSGYVNTMKAHGGGDGPEAVTAALADAFNLPWRPNATKICPLAARVGDKYRGTLLGGSIFIGVPQNGWSRKWKMLLY